MNFALKRGLAALVMVALAAPSASADRVPPDYVRAEAPPRSTALLRYMSFALTDHAPSVEDAKAVAQGEMPVQEVVDAMMTSTRHIERIHRYFHDWFGFDDYPGLLIDDVLLYEDENGVYQHTDSLDPCTPDDTLEAEAWWLEPGQTITVCTELGPEVECDFVEEDDEDADVLMPCGCGASMMGCAPLVHLAEMSYAVSHEFANRAVDVYQQGGSWMELLGGDYVYTNRWLYYYYMYTGQPYEMPPGNADDLQILLKLPTSAYARHSMPAGPERAGVVTSPIFLTRFNNFRSRIRALTENLLCRDVDGRSNIDGTDSFYNEDLDELTLSHADDVECSYCHYPMDNMGSILMDWEEEGLGYGELSTLGHVYGETGEGPAFLMRGYIERAPEFYGCMAKRAWESFSGASWESLDPSDQGAFTEDAESGPRVLLQSVMLSPLMRALRR
jgi:hypothetical protein